MREQVRALLALETTALLDHLDSRLRTERLQQELLLLQALAPVAQAMQRQDSLAQQRHQEQKELLLEILQGQQPSARTQISPLIGLPTQQLSFPSSES